MIDNATQPAYGLSRPRRGGSRTTGSAQTSRPLAPIDNLAALIGGSREDAEGQCVGKTAAGQTQHFVCGPDRQLLGVYDAATGAVIENLVNHDGVLVATIRGGVRSYIKTDHLGTPRLVTNQSGAVIWRWDSDPFGSSAPTQDPDGDGSPFVLNLRFPGQWFDAETVRHYNYFRDYDPAHGRYVQSDPTGLEGGLNLFTYVLGNPLRFFDPLGLGACYVHFDGYPINIPGSTWSAPLGHAGVVSWDNSTGVTRYYEYGRYSSDFGNVRRRGVPDVDVDGDGNVSEESWNRLRDFLSENYGRNRPVSFTCDPQADHQRVNECAERRKNDPNRRPYSWNPLSPNHCKTFAREALEAGQ